MYPGEHARRHPDKPAFIMATSGETLTFGQLESRANQVAHLLREQGVKRLDHVAFMLPNSLELLVCESAGERTGVYYTTVNTGFTASEAAWIVDDSGARVVFVSQQHAAVALDLRQRCAHVERWIMVGDGDLPEGFEAFEDAIAAYPDTPIADEQLGSAMYYSSGTTGRPKGIRWPLRDVHPAEPLAIYDLAREFYAMHPDMVLMTTAPLFHSTHQGAAAIACRLGATTVVMERFSTDVFLDVVDRYAVTNVMMVPTMFSRLLAEPEERRAAFDGSSLRAIVHTGAPCPPHVKRRMIDWWGPILIEVLGATEANGVAVCNSTEWLERPGTVGRAVVGEIVIRDEDGDELGAGEVGEVWFRGATTFEYHNDAEKTASTRSADGDMSTVGDVGYVDDDGYLFITDRKIDMVISGGHNIYPREIEDTLSAHPDVEDVGVIGVPHHDLGEIVKAVVKPVPTVTDHEALRAALEAHCAAHLARYKCPRDYAFAEELPRLATGKLVKRFLREQHGASPATRATVR